MCRIIAGEGVLHRGRAAAGFADELVWRVCFGEDGSGGGVEFVNSEFGRCGLCRFVRTPCPDELCRLFGLTLGDVRWNHDSADSTGNSLPSRKRLFDIESRRVVQWKSGTGVIAGRR